MRHPRPSSQSSSTYSTQKPKFQKKLRPRIKGNSLIEQQFSMNTTFSKQPQLNSSQLQISMDLINNPQDWTSSPLTSRKQKHVSPKQQKQTQNNELNRTDNQFGKTKFSQNCSDQCICQDCTCGRHLCKNKSIKPELSKSTIYENQFMKKSSNPVKVVFAKEYDQLNGPHLLMNSTQRISFSGKKGDQLQRPKPEDLLKSQGPAQTLTTYSTLFPGHKGANQYIKPTDRYIRDKFPLRSKSSYSDTFGKKNFPKDDYKYFDDQLKTGGNWYGNSSYGKFFVNPNPEYHAKKVKIIQKKEENPNFKYQYETIYKNDFIAKQTAVCGSKIKLQSRERGFHSASKQNFGQNSDFKGISPQFQPFSTSGQLFT